MAEPAVLADVDRSTAAELTSNLCRLNFAWACPGDLTGNKLGAAFAGFVVLFGRAVVIVVGCDPG